MRLVQCGQRLAEYHRPSTVMLPFRLIYSDDYYPPIGAHVLPAEKYRLVHRRLLDTKIAEPADFLTPQPASDQDILLVHKPEYVNKLKNGTLSPLEEMQMEIPYSPELVRAFWLAAGGFRSGEHTSVLQSRPHLVCRLLLVKKKTLTSA